MADFKYTTDEALNARINSLQEEVNKIRENNGTMLVGKGLKADDIVYPRDVNITSSKTKDGTINGIFTIVWDNGASCGAKWIDCEQEAKALMTWINDNKDVPYYVETATKSKGTFGEDGFKPSFYEIRKATDAEIKRLK